MLISDSKSTLLSKATHTASEAAAYEFTTLTVFPAVLDGHTFTNGPSRPFLVLSSTKVLGFNF